jgi:hypothetical protein
MIFINIEQTISWDLKLLRRVTQSVAVRCVELVETSLSNWRSVRKDMSG